MKEEVGPASAMLCVFKKFDDGQSLKKRRLCQVTCIMLYSLFWISWLSWLRISRLSWNVGIELPLYAPQYLRRVQITHDLAMQALVWLHMVWFREI